MLFDWENFLDRHGIAYVRQGKNVARDHIAVPCPWCGSADPSQHMGISLRGEGWGCLRNADHRGKSRARLIRELIGCDWPTAVRLGGDDDAAILSGGTFSDELNKLFVKPEAVMVQPRDKLVLPAAFRPFGKGSLIERPYANDLKIRRGLTSAQIKTLTDGYDMYYCVTGEFSGRIIFLVYFEGDLVTWTGRAISDLANIRYKALPREIAVISHYLLWFDDLIECDADTLLLTEGPYDALKINILGHRDGIRATCFFTSAPTREQIELLHDLVPHFRRCFLLLDRGTELMTMQVSNSLRGLGIEPLYLEHQKDPDAMRSKADLHNLLDGWID